MRTSRMPLCICAEVALEGAMEARELVGELARVRARGCAARSTRRASAVRTMASSPTMFIRRSSLRMSTRTVWLTERSDSSLRRRRLRAGRLGAADGAIEGVGAAREAAAPASGTLPARGAGRSARRASAARTTRAAAASGAATASTAGRALGGRAPAHLLDGDARARDARCAAARPRRGSP